MVDNGGMSPRRVLQALPIQAGPGAIDALTALRRALDGEGPALLPVDAGDPDQAGVLRHALAAGDPLLPGEDDADDPTALVVGTSGSTGTPKGVLLAASALRASAHATHDRLGGPGHWLLALPPHHIAGVQVLVRALLSGTKPRAVDVTGGFRPGPFVEAAQRTLGADGPHYTSLVPTQLSRLLDEENSLRALRGFDAVLLGGAATPRPLLCRARDSGVAIVRTYGMSETAGGCVYDGVPLDGAEVRIDGAEPGPIALSGPMLARGYRRGERFDAWFRTGDLGTWRDGRLDVLGRGDDVIITGGVNVAPAQVERPLVEHAGVREACAVGLDDAEWGQIVAAAVVPVDASAPPPVAELREAVRARCGSAAAPKRVAYVEELPLRGPGKTDREGVRALLR